MGNWQQLFFPDDTALVEGAAERWITELAGSEKSRPYLIALSGGRTPQRFYVSVVAKLKGRGDLLNHVHFFWSDERCVPPTSSDSNYAIAAEHLFAPLQIPQDRIHRVHGELEPSEATQLAEKELFQWAPKNGAGEPILDLVMLGMGEDGHVASLFPGETEEAASSPKVFRHVIGPKPPPNRISMGYGVLAAAKQAWVLISGAGKEKPLLESISPSGTTPLARLIKRRSSTHLFSTIPVNLKS